MIFKKKQAQANPEPAGKVARPEWDLRTMAQRLGELAPALETKDIEPPLVQARLADHYRELGREPVPPPEFDRIVQGLDADSWRRLALAVDTLDHPDLRSALAGLKTAVVEQVRAGFVGTATATDALSLSLLRQSAVRVEEFARHLADRLGVFWKGESADQSKQRLRQLDYKRLLAEAEIAKKQAEERMEYLRKKQEEDVRRRFRGKQ
jgi:hypothetical protein